MRAIIAAETPDRGDPVRRLLLGLGVECGAADCVTFADLLLRLRQAPADVVLVVLAGDAGGACALLPQLAAAGVTALAVGPTPDSRPILEVIRAGAAGYLDEARLRDELIAAFDRLRRAGTLAYRRGQTVAVLAAAPGTGVTTVATGTAFALAARAPGDVALAEAAPGVPGLALNLDLRPEYTVADLVPRWEQMDAALLRRVLVKHSAGVHVLAYRAETLQAPPLPAPAMRQAVLLLGALFDVTVLDLGHAADAACLEALGLATTVLLVVRLDVPSLRLTRQLVRQLTAQGVPPEKLRVVPNRYGQRKQLALKTAGEVLGLPLGPGIPDDPATLNQACNLGRPPVALARWAAVTRGFARLARSLPARVA